MSLAGFDAFLLQLVYDSGLSAAIYDSMVDFLCAVNRIKYESNNLSGLFFHMSSMHFKTLFGYINTH